MATLTDYPYQAGRFERGYVILSIQGSHDSYHLVRICPQCSEVAVVTVPAQGLWDWEHGKFVQEAMPDLSADQREMIINGLHPKCFDALFGPEEEQR